MPAFTLLSGSLDLTWATAWAPHVAATCIAFLIHSVMKWLYLRKSMPPGPLGLPWIGNTQQMPAVKPWLKFTEWGHQYGAVISVLLGSTSVIVLNTAHAARELLEKRSNIYSSRPRFIIGNEILSQERRGFMQPYDDKWRKWRKILHSGFHNQMAQSYRSIQSFESKLMIADFLEAPNEYERHFQKFAGSVVTSIVYGRRIKSMDEFVIKEHMNAIKFLTNANLPGKYIVESWPWLLKLPHRLQWFRWAAEERRKHDENYLMLLYREVESKMNTTEGVSTCLTAQTISHRAESGMSDMELAYAVAAPFGAAIETTSGTLETLLLAILHYPEVMKKAQAEIDRVVGHDRMPEFSDKDDLPYVVAVICEAMRWRPIAPLNAIPHAVTVDDEYNGMYIPKGATVYANTFGIMHDHEMFPSPDDFLPERFLNTSDPLLKDFELPFGYGRRICPGMHLARNSLFIVAARLFWAFDILPSLGPDGQKKIPDAWNYTNSFASKPVRFECRIVPRNPKVVTCIEREREAAKDDI